MRIPTFIGATSLLLASWLGVAFIRDVPTGSYPVIERSLVGKAAPSIESTQLTSRVQAPNEP